MLFGCLLLSCISIYAQTSPSDPLPLDPKLKVGKLSNGLTYYIRQNKLPEQKVELRLVVNAGSILEENDQQGLAHMAEHMAFNGTTHFKKNEIVSFLQNIGVGFGSDLNAYTSFDETVYILPIPTDKPGNLEKGFQVLEDWAHNVTYLDEDIQGERPVILEESRLGKGANDRMFRKIYPKLFAGSKYAERLPIGLDSIIKNFNAERLRAFYKDWYRPDLMAVIVVGDIEPTKAEEMIKKHFASLTNPQNEKVREGATVPPYKESDAMVVTDKEATNYLISINYPAVKVKPATTVADYRNDIVENLFTSILNQRLQELTQKENPPFVFASTNFETFAKGYKSFNAFASVGTGDVNKGLSALAEEIERVKRYGVTADELERAKKNSLSMYEKAYNNRDKTESADYVEEYINNFTQQEPTPGIEKEYEYVKSILPTVNVEEVNAVVNKFRNEHNKFVYVTGPEPKQGQASLEGKDLLATIEAKEKADIKPYEEKAVTTNLLAVMPVPGKSNFKNKRSRARTTELKLSNGVMVTLKPTTFKDDEVLMAATRAGGKNNYGLADKFSADIVLAVVSAMGVGNFSPTDLKKALAGKSVSVSPIFSGTSEGVHGNSTKKDLETMFQLNYLYFTQPRKDTALFKSFVQRNKSQNAMRAANPQAAFIDTMYKTLYNNNPLAPIVLPKSEYFDKIDLDRSLAIYKERFGDANGMKFVFVGSFNEQDIIPLIEKYLGSLPSTNKKFNYVDNKVRPVTGRKELIVNKGKEQKSLILAFYTGEVPFSEDLELKAQAMSDILNIRIVEELREKIQGIYGGGTFSTLEKIPYSNYDFVLQLPCGPEKVDTLIKAVKKEFANIAEKGPEKSYLDKVKKQWIEEYKSSIKENATWLENIMMYKSQGGNPDRFVHYEKYVNALTPNDVQQAAKIILQSKNQFYAVLMPETVLKGGEQEKKKGF